ncbi:MAG: sulfite exporter TauE/SafE family protein [Parvularculaceae bacterium]
MSEILDPYYVVAVIAAGLAAGFAGGFFGIGGGVVTVPALYALFRAMGAEDDASLKTAIGTSLAVIVVTSLRALGAHRRAGAVDGEVLRAWSPWIALGSAAAGLLSRHIPVELLASVFAGGAFFIAAQRLSGRKRDAARVMDLSHKAIHIPVGVGTGLFSGLMGLGGGAVGVMVMRWAGRSIHQAVATASGFGVAVAVPGAVGFLIAGLAVADKPPGSIGYVEIPAFIVMAIAGGLAAPVGARLAHKVKGDALSALFGAYIALAGLALIIDVFFR